MPDDREEKHSKLNTASTDRRTHSSDVGVSLPSSSTLHPGAPHWATHSPRGQSPFTSAALSFWESAKGNSFRYSCQTGTTNNGKTTINYYSSGFNRHAGLTNPIYKFFISFGGKKKKKHSCEVVEVSAVILALIYTCSILFSLYQKLPTAFQPLALCTCSATENPFLI